MRKRQRCVYSTYVLVWMGGDAWGLGEWEWSVGGNGIKMHGDM